MSDVAVVELIRISDLTSLIKHILPHHDAQASRRRRVEMRPAQSGSFLSEKRLEGPIKIYIDSSYEN
jgi:hypothetical protein